MLYCPILIDRAGKRFFFLAVPENWIFMNGKVYFMLESKIRIKKRAATLMPAVLAGVLLACTAGCHSSDSAAPLPAPAQPPAQSQADAVQKIQDNPKIPPGVKASILAHMQGTDRQPTTPAATHP